MELPDLSPYLGQVTFGGLAGYAVGYALKKVGRFLAIALGLLFIAVQLLAQAGYIQVDWTRIQKDVEPLLKQPGLQNLWER
ncbi:FUN14 domain-containing protein, partial [Escherichia coli]|nr:FUN14 domain-containing protein [Escherichia coli]